jgi:hypothetical protein
MQEGLSLKDIREFCVEKDAFSCRRHFPRGESCNVASLSTRLRCFARGLHQHDIVRMGQEILKHSDSNRDIIRNVYERENANKKHHKTLIPNSLP